MRYQGRCHCGKIALEVEGELNQAMQCNCSICSRKGYLLWMVPREKMRLLTPQGDIASYTFNTHRIQHYFCPICGCTPYCEGTGPHGQASAAINVRCLEGVDPATLTIVAYDGRSK